MALKKVLVLGSNGLPQQLQSGDYVNASSIPQYTNGESSASLTLGMPVYMSAADTVKRAESNALGTSFVVGLCNDSTITASSLGGIATSNIVTGTTTQWDAVAGTTGGLAANTMYFLSPSTPGYLTATAPSTVGQYVCPVGIGVSTTEMKINILIPILL